MLALGRSPPRSKKRSGPAFKGCARWQWSVVLDHLLAWPSGGFVGVDVFFVISGFLITGYLVRTYETTGRISFSDFYIKRIKRILPAATLVLLASVIAGFVVFNQIRAGETLVDGIWSMFFAANWRQTAIGTDYFSAPGPVSPLQHYWSLAVEEQFYFVWPMLMLAVVISSAKVFRAGNKPRLVAVSAMLLLTGGSFAWSIWETATGPTVAYFSTFSRAWELGIGALLAIASPLLPRIADRVRPYLAWAGLVGIAVSLFVIDASVAFPAPTAALPVLATALVIAAGTVLFPCCSFGLSGRFSLGKVHTIGKCGDLELVKSTCDYVFMYAVKLPPKRCLRSRP